MLFLQPTLLFGAGAQRVTTRSARTRGAVAVARDRESGKLFPAFAVISDRPGGTCESGASRAARPPCRHVGCAGLARVARVPQGARVEIVTRSGDTGNARRHVEPVVEAYATADGSPIHERETLALFAVARDALAGENRRPVLTSGDGGISPAQPAARRCDPSPFTRRASCSRSRSRPAIPNSPKHSTTMNHPGARPHELRDDLAAGIVRRAPPRWDAVLSAGAAPKQLVWRAEDGSNGGYAVRADLLHAPRRWGNHLESAPARAGDGFHSGAGTRGRRHERR